ncbi:MAG TPA: DUF5615 family PIN-like protein [Firmicutes bacterium]|nr:DUF5615 family PIN-like protein [Candidatus Fermentithermobacillaceae bacterium]
MRFLVDNALSPWIAGELRQFGHDVVHVREIGMASASDAEILALAVREKRIVLTADTDFGTIMARTRADSPSVIIFRQSDKRPMRLLNLLTTNLSRIAPYLEKGAVVVFQNQRIRVRRLPLLPG